MSEDFLALVDRFHSPDPDERYEAVRDAYTCICHQAQTVYPETLETIEPLVALAIDPGCPGRADALKLLADIAGSWNSEPRDYEAVRSAVKSHLPNIMRSVTVNPTRATVVALAQLAWSYPGDAAVDKSSLGQLLQQFEEASVVLSVALALEVQGDSAAHFAFDAAFGEADASTEQGHVGEPVSPGPPLAGIARDLWRWVRAGR